MTEEQLKEERKRLYATLHSFRLHEMGVPGHLHNGLVSYVLDGYCVGGFLRSVISNDLQKAVAHADHANKHNLSAVVAWMYNEAPSACWGSPQKYDDWLEKHRRPVTE